MSTQAQINTLKKITKSGKLKSDKETIREYLKFKDGMSSRDLEQTLGMIHESYSARLSELVTAGEVFYQGTQLEFHSEHSRIFYEHSKEIQIVRAKRIKQIRFAKSIRKLINNPLLSEEAKEVLTKELTIKK